MLVSQTSQAWLDPRGGGSTAVRAAERGIIKPRLNYTTRHRAHSIREDSLRQASERGETRASRVVPPLVRAIRGTGCIRTAHRWPTGSFVCVKRGSYTPASMCRHTCLVSIGALLGREGGGGGGVSTIKITWADTRAAQRRRPGSVLSRFFFFFFRRVSLLLACSYRSPSSAPIGFTRGLGSSIPALFTRRISRAHHFAHQITLPSSTRLTTCAS